MPQLPPISFLSCTCLEHSIQIYRRVAHIFTTYNKASKWGRSPRTSTTEVVHFSATSSLGGAPLCRPQTSKRLLLENQKNICHARTCVSVCAHHPCTRAKEISSQPMVRITSTNTFIPDGVHVSSSVLQYSYTSKLAHVSSSYHHITELQSSIDSHKYKQAVVLSCIVSNTTTFLSLFFYDTFHDDHTDFL